MPEIKISEMPELIPYDNYTLEGGTDTQDYLPILDTSEVDPDFKNKKVSIGTLFDDYTRQYNSNNVDLKIASVERITLTNNLFEVDFTTQLYLFLDPNGVNRVAQIFLFLEGERRYIKNISATNTLTLQNMVTNNNTSTLTHVLNPSKTVQIIYDGIDHHVIALN
jgi:hypothetical protein